MKKLLVHTLLPLLFPASFLFAQAPCDSLEFSKKIARAGETWQSENFGEAPGQLLTALSFLENCAATPTQKAAVYEQAAVWHIALEQFDQADENLKKAKALLFGTAIPMIKIDLLEARLALAAHQFERCTNALDAVFNSPSPRNDTLRAEAWMLRAKLFYFLTKPEQGLSCLDSALAIPACTKSLPLYAKALATRVELDFILGVFKQGIHLADSVLTLLSGEQKLPTDFLPASKK